MGLWDLEREDVELKDAGTLGLGDAGTWDAVMWDLGTQGRTHSRMCSRTLYTNNT